jgi:phosphatidylinositol-3,4,5-trisphosphate 3-phosphatase/dual-specificity protein phosphatase PTEN
LAYITPNMLAMGFPSFGMESLYRNSYEDTIGFLDSKHGEFYKVYNLCSERGYPLTEFHGRVGYFPFEDHGAPPFLTLVNVCIDMKNYLAQNVQNVCAIHCKAGKGRTGTVICCMLVLLGLCPSSETAMTEYGLRRTSNGKGVTIPSQRRYVGYYEQFLHQNMRYTPVTFDLVKIEFNKAPDMKGGSCSPYFSIEFIDIDTVPHWEEKRPKPKKSEFKPKTITSYAAGAPITLELPAKTHIHGDIKIKMMHKVSGIGKSDEKIGSFCFNAAFVNTLPELILTKPEIDGPHKDKKHKVFAEDFTIKVTFGPASS